MGSPLPQHRRSVARSQTAIHRLLRSLCLISLLLLGELLTLEAARSTPRSRRRKKRSSGEYVPGQFLVIMKYLVLLVFAPAILFFVYSIVRDPVTPHLVWELFMRCRERLSGNLGDTGVKPRLSVRRRVARD